MKKKENTPSHISKTSVFYDIGFTNSEAAALTVKADLYLQVLNIIRKRKLSQNQLIKILKQPQPRISELLNGKISRVSIEKLISYLECLGEITSIKIKLKKQAS